MKTGFIQNGKGRKMNDSEIVDLYWKREERAVEETAKKYGYKEK